MRTFLILMLLAGSSPGAFASDVPELEVVAKDLPAYNLAYIRTVGVYGNAEVMAAFEKITVWAEGKGLFSNSTVIIGVYQDDPGVVPMEECRYDASVTVPVGTEAEGGVGVYKLPAGRYAVYTASGLSCEKIGEEVEKAYGDLMAWWPTGGYAMDKRPWLELYHLMTKEDFEAGTFVVDICVPIKGE